MFTLTIIINFVILLNLTLIGGILPLIERKYLGLIQRRVGPKHVGYKGRLQFIADALKVFLKGAFVPHDANKFFYFLWPAVALSSFYFMFLNAYWGRNVIYLEVEYNLLYVMLVEFFINISIVLIGYFSKNKYSFIGSIRAASMVFAVELLLGVLTLIIVTFTNSFNISKLFFYQEEYPLIFVLLPIIPFLFLLIMLEVCKSPFDLSEAETELVTGYHTEYGGFFFGLYYLGEYIHIFFASNFLIVLVFGCKCLAYQFYHFITFYLNLHYLILFD